MNFSDYTEDRICQEFGFPSFASDPFLVNSKLSLRLLLQPSFDAEVCISLVICGPTATLQVAAFAEAFQYQPSPAWHPAFDLELCDIPLESTQTLIVSTEETLRNLPKRGLDIIDGMGFSLVILKKGWPSHFDGNASSKYFQPIIAPLILLALEYVQKPLCTRAVRQAGYYVDLRFEAKRDTKPFPSNKLLILGTPAESQEVIQALRKIPHQTED
ncbi:MAG TPA: hypothetical protein PLL06_06795 [Acidobacteriota bacterium]|nr:hypothetical protein [Acidobacteriota bacterium]HNH84040.1 hypothetical protein [Acidobacteriota bacterium]